MNTLVVTIKNINQKPHYQFVMRFFFYQKVKVTYSKNRKYLYEKLYFCLSQNIVDYIIMNFSKL